jgi:histidinol-phosphate aminotransferase
MIAARPALTALAARLPATVPFVGPEALERTRGRPFRARIGANESGFGPSPKVIAAMRAAATDVWKYGDPENHDLKAAIAAHLGVSAANVAIGAGVDGLLGLIVRLYVEQGQPVVASLGGYPTFNYHVVGYGGRLVTVPYVDDREDLDGLLAAVGRGNAPLVYLANPDNPMGTWWEAAEISRLIEALPETTMLVLDEAYGETAPASAIPPLDVSRPNVLRMRTFSKAYGLAGMRCGYALGEAGAVAGFDKVRDHFGMCRMTQAAALAALADGDYLAATVSEVAASRARIAEVAARSGLSCLPSATNFVAIDCGGDGAFALAVLEELIARDIFVRKPATAPLDRCIRVSAGPAAEMDAFAEAFPAALAAARARV